MKILGIGNAIIDTCKVSEDFLEKNSLKKSTMKLVDEDEFSKLLASKNRGDDFWGFSCKFHCGPSQLGNDVGFIGKINDDNLGKNMKMD